MLGLSSKASAHCVPQRQQQLVAASWPLRSVCLRSPRGASSALTLGAPALVQELQRGTIARAASRESSSSQQPFRNEDQRYPFHENDFHRVAFVPPPYGPLRLYEDVKGGNFNGVLCFKRDDDLSGGDELSVMEVFVSGDTAFNTWSQLTHRTTDRPMVHDLMWNLLERAREGSAATLTLLRVAIVELRDNVFIGRLFFGNPETGEVSWDCDCRPSDGCYLSIRAQCPFFVHRRVWEMACLPIRHSSVYKLVSASTYQTSSSSSSNHLSSTGALSGLPPSPSSPSSSASSSSWHSSSSSSSSLGDDGGSGVTHHQWAPLPEPGEISNAAPLTVEEVSQLRPDDLPAITLLKRQLALAVKEEDYAEASRVRDHPWMKMYRDMHVLRMQGRYDNAHRVEMELRRQVDGNL